MPAAPYSPAYLWINVSDSNMASYQVAVEQFQQMSEASVVIQAGEAGGKIIQVAAQRLILGETTTNGSVGTDYTDVAGRIAVWSDTENTYVGVRPGDPLESKAEELDRLFPALDNAFDLSSDEARKYFEYALSEATF